LYLGRLGKFKYWKKLKKYLKKLAKPVQNMINYRQSYYQRPELELVHTKPIEGYKFLTKGMKLELDHDLDNIETKADKLTYLNHYKLKDNGEEIIEEYEDSLYNAEAHNDDYEDPDPGSSSGSDSESDKDLDEAEEGLIWEIRPKWKRKSEKEKEKQRKEKAKREKERKAKERQEKKLKEREEKERKERERRERQKDEESEEESEIEDSIIIEDSEDDDEERFEEDEEENLEVEIQDPLQFLLPTVEETDWEDLNPLLLQMQNTLNLFESKHRTVRISK
jgi:hypothetical protein